MLGGMRNRMHAWLLGVAGLVLALGVSGPSGVAAQAAGPTLPAAAPAAPAAAAPAANASSAAGAGTVHLKNGGFVRGELIELQPGTLVRVKLADGSVREVPWSDVDHVTDPSLPPPAPRAASPGPSLPVAGATLPLAPPSTLAESNADEIQRLRLERDEISNTAPAVMMILGGGAFLLLGLPGLVLLSVGDYCDSSREDELYESNCENVRGTGAVLTAIGVVGGAVAVWGLIKSGSNRDKRRSLNNRILELKGERAGLSFGITPRKHGATFGLTLRM